MSSATVIRRVVLVQSYLKEDLLLALCFKWGYRLCQSIIVHGWKEMAAEGGQDLLGHLQSIQVFT